MGFIGSFIVTSYGVLCNAILITLFDCDMVLNHDTRYPTLVTKALK